MEDTIRLTFSSSSTFVDEHGATDEVVERDYEQAGYAELTYGTLRIGPNGDEIAYIDKDGGWIFEGKKFSDVAISVKDN